VLAHVFCRGARGSFVIVRPQRNEMNPITAFSAAPWRSSWEVVVDPFWLSQALTMKMNPQFALSFNGNCEAAFRCYERCLGGTITFMLTWGNSPSAADVPADWSAKIYHATLKVGDTVIMGADQPVDRYDQPKGFELVLPVDDPLAAERVSRNWRRVERSRCPFRRRFGQVASGSWLIGSGYLGQSTASESPRRQHEESRACHTRPNTRCTRRPLTRSRAAAGERWTSGRRRRLTMLC
jgi:PhnB protein